MNDSTIPGIPTIDHVKHLAQLDPPVHISPTPAQTYTVKYDVQIKVAKGDDPVKQTCNALMIFFQNKECGSLCSYLSLGGE